MLLFPVFAPLPASAEAPQRPAPLAWRLHEEGVLGTSFDLVTVGGDRDDGQAAAAAARAEIARLGAVLDSRSPGAELHAFNVSEGGSVSPDLYAVLKRAQAWRRLTGGAYDPRLGVIATLWDDGEPSDAELAAALAAARHPLRLDPAARSAVKPREMRLALDGLAKGYVVDCALRAARRAAPRLRGLALSIGGDLRCTGEPPDARGWPIASAVSADARLRVAEAAIATSGEGPRDRRTDGGLRSQTLSPETGRPVTLTRAVTVVAPRAADADALATAFMVMHPDRALALADRLDGVAATVALNDGSVSASRRWAAYAAPPKKAAPAPAAKPPVPPPPPAANPNRWPPDWAVELSYVAPDKRDDNDPDFRTPYMVIWITDAQNHPVRTVMMVGKDPKWQKDNFIWWDSNRAAALKLVELRSEATALSGRYSLFWRGVDDAYDRLQAGDYLLHVETSQEHGKHTHRTLPLKIGRSPFETVLPPTREGGGLKINYGLNP